jgi:DNA helicase-2/ATP-dependent DNA helicase PcrA
MNHWHSIRLKAQQLHAEIFSGEDHARQLEPEEILRRLEDHSGIMRQKVAPSNPILQNSLALIVPHFFALFYNVQLREWFSAFCQAHEYAHIYLKHGSAHYCSAEDINLTDVESDAVPLGENRISNYSSRERREREANLFAREIMLPSNVVRYLFINEGWRAADFVRVSGLPYDFVTRQLAFALLISDVIKNDDEKVTAPEETIPVLPDGAENPKALPLDASQLRAACFEGQRLLLEAGPGTGKTRTLVGRILYLLEQNVNPENILALTFSNKAAEEMRERIALYAPDAASKIWLGTFHAFGLETLRKHGEAANLPVEFELLDPLDAQLLLENHLFELDLEHYRSLHQPARHLKGIHASIQRAKDELKNCDDYEKAARIMLSMADNEKELLAANKALEVSAVYRYYEKLLRENDWLDFGDLIYRTVELLQDHAAVKAQLQSRYTHILVDEFQDVNRASSVLVQELTGTGGNLWIVGDQRQTVYRWRGASSANLRQFKSDFPEAETLSLEINYRSHSPVVEILNEIAPQVVASEGFSGWFVPNDKTGNHPGKIRYLETPDFETECEVISQEIRAQNAEGRKFKDLAVLGRTNQILAKVADELTARGIPILYLGNLFERPEIRDLLSLLSLTVPNSGRHLLRLTQMPEYNFTTGDVRRLVKSARESEAVFPDALKLAESNDSLSENVKDKFALLGKHLLDAEDDSVTAWRFLGCYLFDRTDHLLPILADDSVVGRQKRFAIYQFLQLAISEETKSTKLRIAHQNSRTAFLRLIRHLAQSGEESAFRKLPAWAENIDAVPLLTVHAAKGLEFPTVFIPYLGNAYFPNKIHSPDCPLPPTLFSSGMPDAEAEHAEEELCLFFVALSRAKESLILSRATSYGSTSKISRFLNLMPGNLPEPEVFQSILDETADSRIIDILKGFQAEEASSNRPLSFTELKTYHNCPRRYFYEYVLQVRGSHDEAAYLQLHIILREMIVWAKNQMKLFGEIDKDASRVRLREIWQEKPLAAHPYAAAYLQAAELLSAKINSFLSSREINGSDDTTPKLQFDLGGRKISLAPDLLEVSPDNLSVTATRVKTGRAKEKFSDLLEDDKLTIAALYQAASETFPEADVQVSFTYLESGAQFVYDPKNIKTQLNHLKSAVDGISEQKFNAKADSRKCPACAHYFICPCGDL